MFASCLPNQVTLVVEMAAGSGDLLATAVRNVTRWPWRGARYMRLAINPIII